MSDKKIGVLGGSGEIGKRCVNILTEKGYTVMASYRTRKPMENNENVYVQLDICNENELCMFMANCDVVINCAGASFINGEKIARTAAKMKIPLVDPSGESFLEERIKDIQKDSYSCGSAIESGWRYPRRIPWLRMYIWFLMKESQ